MNHQNDKQNDEYTNNDSIKKLVSLPSLNNNENNNGEPSSYRLVTQAYNHTLERQAVSQLSFIDRIIDKISQLDKQIQNTENINGKNYLMSDRYLYKSPSYNLTAISPYNKSISSADIFNINKNQPSSGINIPAHCVQDPLNENKYTSSTVQHTKSEHRIPFTPQNSINQEYSKNNNSSAINIPSYYTNDSIDQNTHLTYTEGQINKSYDIKIPLTQQNSITQDFPMPQGTSNNNISTLQYKIADFTPKNSVIRDHHSTSPEKLEKKISELRNKIPILNQENPINQDYLISKGGNNNPSTLKYDTESFNHRHSMNKEHYSMPPGTLDDKPSGSKNVPLYSNLYESSENYLNENFNSHKKQNNPEPSKLPRDKDLIKISDQVNKNFILNEDFSENSKNKLDSYGRKVDHLEKLKLPLYNYENDDTKIALKNNFDYFRYFSAEKKDKDTKDQIVYEQNKHLLNNSNSKVNNNNNNNDYNNISKGNNSLISNSNENNKVKVQAALPSEPINELVVSKKLKKSKSMRTPVAVQNHKPILEVVESIKTNNLLKDDLNASTEINISFKGIFDQEDSKPVNKTYRYNDK